MSHTKDIVSGAVPPFQRHPGSITPDQDPDLDTEEKRAARQAEADADAEGEA
jgi:hypothetical protein